MLAKMTSPNVRRLPDASEHSSNPAFIWIHRQLHINRIAGKNGARNAAPIPYFSKLMVVVILRFLSISCLVDSYFPCLEFVWTANFDPPRQQINGSSIEMAIAAMTARKSKAPMIVPTISEFPCFILFLLNCLTLQQRAVSEQGDIRLKVVPKKSSPRWLVSGRTLALVFQDFSVTGTF